MTNELDLDKYTKVEWVSGGREFPLLDCYGVVNEVRRDLGLPEWPEYAGAERDDLDELSSEAKKERQGSELVDGAVAFCYSGSVVVHVAVLAMVDGRMQAIECNPEHNVTVMPVSRMERRFPKVEYYS